MQVTRQLVGSIQKQLDALKVGFTDLIPADKCTLLSGIEFDMVLCGMGTVRDALLVVSGLVPPARAVSACLVVSPPTFASGRLLLMRLVCLVLSLCRSTWRTGRSTRRITATLATRSRSDSRSILSHSSSVLWSLWPRVLRLDVSVFPSLSENSCCSIHAIRSMCPCLNSRPDHRRHAQFVQPLVQCLLLSITCQ
jgi:hypothetical protein